LEDGLEKFIFFCILLPVYTIPVDPTGKPYLFGDILGFTIRKFSLLKKPTKIFLDKESACSRCLLKGYSM